MTAPVAQERPTEAGVAEAVRRRGLVALLSLMQRYGEAYIEARTPQDRRDIRAAVRAGLVQRISHYETSVNGSDALYALPARPGNTATSGKDEAHG